MRKKQGAVNMKNKANKSDCKGENMKIKCEKRVLIDAINTVSRAVPTRTPIELLKGIKLTASGGKLTLVATDLNMTIIKSIDVEVMASGEMVLPAKLFADVVRSMPNNETIELTTTDNTAVVKAKKLKFKVTRYANDDEYPDVFGNTNEKCTTMKMNCDVFERLVSETAFAASIDESRGILMGLLIETTSEYTRMVGIDGFRLALAQSPFGDKQATFVVNASSLSEVAKIAQSKYGTDIIVDITEKTVSFRFDDTKVIARILEGEFVEYQKLIPDSGTINVEISKDDLKNSLMRATLLAKEGKHNLIKCEVQGDVMTVSAQSEQGELREEIPITHADNDLTIGFNSKYVLDALNNISEDHETVKLTMNSPNSACTITPVQGDEFEHLVLPVRL